MKYEAIIGGKPIKWWTEHVPVDENAAEQVRNIARMPFIHKHVAVMPDVHLGKGATVGSVIPTKNALIPAAVGVDIGCGMNALKLEIRADQLPDSLALMRSLIEEAVPHGRTDNGGPNDEGAYTQIPREVEASWASGLHNQLKRLCWHHPKLHHGRALNQLGTLGGGNHFIEVCTDEADGVWLMLHSGSRGQGNRIGSYFIEKAKREMEGWFIDLPDKDLAYLPKGHPLFVDYWNSLKWAQDYAHANREVMMVRAVRAVSKALGFPAYEFGVGVMQKQVISCHHNYVDIENHFGENIYVTRKGAVRARVGDLGIIPGAMGKRSFIVEGKGNADSFNSCSHGAGRVHSRGAAKKLFTVEDHVLDTQGVECRKDEGVLDETPQAYKNIDDVMASQADLVDVKHTLSAVLCVKG